MLGKNLPKILEVTLLSEEELEAYGDFIPDTPDHEPGYFYLRTPHEENLIGLGCGKWVEDPTDPDYHDIRPESFGGTALRPTLRLESSALKDGTTLEAGDNVVIGKNTFTALSDTILFSDRAVWYDWETNSFGYFDDETNVYENSLAKQRVDAWFEEKIKPVLSAE